MDRHQIKRKAQAQGNNELRQRIPGMCWGKLSDSSEIIGTGTQGAASLLIKCARNEDMRKRCLEPLLGYQTTQTTDIKKQEFLKESHAGRRKAKVLGQPGEGLISRNLLVRKHCQRWKLPRAVQHHTRSRTAWLYAPLTSDLNFTLTLGYHR